ncbi:MAG: hypothetical protein MZV64_60175 [Ignavibacteriales bacterium]|nr:hypothetical protein [Ignavibacteriales bacterium]
MPRQHQQIIEGGRGKFDSAPPIVARRAYRSRVSVPHWTKRSFGAGTCRGAESTLSTPGPLSSEFNSLCRASICRWISRLRRSFCFFSRMDRVRSITACG